MADQGPKNSSDADDAIRAALESVERLEQERGGAAADDDLDPDSVEVIGTGEPGEREREALEASGIDDDPPGDEADEEIELVDEGEPEPASGGGSAQGALLQSMIDAKNEAVQVLEQTQKEAKSLRERLMRVSAEFDNYKKRVGREKEEAIKFANESVLKELLPVLDNFERSLQGAQAAKDGDQPAEQALDTVLQGVEMVYKQLSDSLGRFGVEAFTAVGQRFDPAQHEAVSTREDPSVPNQTVLEEYQRGYKLHGRLVRPAMVIVSSGGPPAAKPKSDPDHTAGQGEDDAAASGDGN